MMWLIRTAVLVVAFCVLVPSASAQERVIGLLTVPELFGEFPCDRFSPRDIPLYPTAMSMERIGALRVDRYWTFPDGGGCQGLLVNAHLRQEGNIGSLPTREYDYEKPAAVVLQAKDEWFKVQIPDGTAWVKASEQSRYFPLEVLLPDKLTYVTGESDGHLFEYPGESETGVTLSGHHPVRVIEAANIEGQQWLHVEVLSHSVCDGGDYPVVTTQGWMPAHGPSGQPAVWFYSRGC